MLTDEMTSKPWSELVDEANKNSQPPKEVAYEFSNGKKFEQPK